MYAFISGKLEDTGPPTVVSAAGVGYELWLPERDRLRLPAAGETVRIFTHLQVREDDLTLYGFPRAADREIFRALLAVNGVGPRVALAVLGSPDTEDVLRGIRRGDSKPLLRIKGIGKKTAERMVLELEDKAAAWVGAEPLRAAEAAAGARPGDGESEDAVLALEAMGLSSDRARAAVAAVSAEQRGAGVEALLRAALQHLQPPA